MKREIALPDAGISQENQRRVSNVSIVASSSTLSVGEYSVVTHDYHSIGMSPPNRTTMPTSYNHGKWRDFAWAGDTYGYLPPGMHQSGAVLNQSETTYVLLSTEFFRNVAKDVVDIASIDTRNLIALDDRVGASLITALGETVRNGGTNEWPILIEAIATSLAIRLMQQLGGTLLKYDDRAARLARVVEYINDNSHKRIELEELAAVACLSTFHFSRQFKKTYGKTPQEYVMGVRVEKALRLIKASSAPLIVIATAEGFSSQAHMTTVIKAHTGFTPGQHQRNFGLKSQG